MRGERGEVVGERERSVWRGVGWVGGTHPVFSVMLLCSSFPPLIFNVGKKKPMVAVWMRQTTSLQSPPPKPHLPPPPLSLGGDWQFTECPHVISCPAAAASSAACWEEERRGKKEGGKMARWMEACIHPIPCFITSM